LEIALVHEKKLRDPVVASMRCRTVSIRDIRLEETLGARAASRISVVSTIPKILIVAEVDSAWNEGLRLDHSNLHAHSLRTPREAAMRPFVTVAIRH